MQEKIDGLNSRPVQITIEHCGLGRPTEEVKKIDLESGTDKFKAQVKNWFGKSSLKFVRDKLINEGAYSEPVGQGISGRIEVL